MSDPLPKSLIAGVEDAVASELGVRSCRHKSALKSLSACEEQDIARVVFQIIAENWRMGQVEKQFHRSRQNWRWSLQPQISAHNQSPEIVLERAIAAACSRLGRDDWANQVPVASGLILGAADGRRAIDLVQRRQRGHYELIELKVGSDTPLYAAVEAIGYAIIWLLTRMAQGAVTSPLLSADRLDVRVLAPSGYYERFELKALERSIDRSLRELGKRHSVVMTFAYDVLADDILPGPQLADELLLTGLDERSPLHCTEMAPNGLYNGRS